MRRIRQLLANWGNYPRINAEVLTPETREEACLAVASAEHLIARGNGKCYGDAALGDPVLSTLALNRLIRFDPIAGEVECESGLLLSDLLPIIVRAGWFFHVTPGIKAITVGGAIASDVHGKNHPLKGCFSNWLISFELLRADGSVLRCSRMEYPGLFWQTCGGMGFTGVVLSARFRLMPLPSGQMHQATVRAPRFEALFQALSGNTRWPYAAAWVDGLSTGSSFGRGAVYFADHAEATSPNSSFIVHHSSFQIPFYAPESLLNPLTIRAHNTLRYARARNAEKMVGLDSYFYPLDSIGHWNRLYGRRGFIQYQFCLPEKTAFDGMVDLLQTIQRSPDAPFLTVLKRHGERPVEAVHSFPIKGYSLALDFPRTRTVFDLVKKLDAIVGECGGRIYLAKDACSSPRLAGLDPLGFGEQKFQSEMRKRLQLG